jgi:DNA-binding MarR family transcriptional regulator
MSNSIYDDRADLPGDLRALLRLGDAISTAHFRMVAALQRIHGDDHLAASTRALLRNLIARGPLSVPEIAALRPSSRQFVQRIVDALLPQGLVVTRPNPRHKRSPLIAITRTGRARVAQMIAVEQRFLRAAIGASRVRRKEMESAARVIERLVATFDTVFAEPADAE